MIIDVRSDHKLVTFLKLFCKAPKTINTSDHKLSNNLSRLLMDLYFRFLMCFLTASLIHKQLILEAHRRISTSCREEDYAT